MSEANSIPAACSSPAVAFMQNMWVRDPARVRAIIDRHGEEARRKLIYQFLFAGCISGRRLKAAFGNLIDTIAWDEASPEIADNPKTICAPCPEHIRRVLNAYNPKVVVTFGRVASEAVSKIWLGPLIQTTHPAARQADVPSRLKDAARQVSECLGQNAELSSPEEASIFADPS